MSLRLWLFVLLAGCAVEDLDRGIDADAGGNPPSECRAETYDFAGQGTFAGLGLVGQSLAELPDPSRPAMIWVTRDLLPFDHGEPGGPVEMTRMLCFEFADGSGGTDWPINAAWQPPGASTEAAGPIDAAPWVLVAVVALLILGASVLAFRRGA